jgi:hypothetical protein
VRRGKGPEAPEDLLLYFPGPGRKAEPGTLLAPAGDAQKLVVLDF